MTRDAIYFPPERWRDRRWCALPSIAQTLYGFTIPSDRYVDWAGVAPLRPRAWASAISGMPDERIENALTALADDGWVVIDRATDELWLRTFMTDQNVLRVPNLLKRALTDAAECASAAIRTALADQLAASDIDLDGPGLVIGRPVRAAIPDSRRAEVFRRDRWTCQGCGRVIAPTTDAQRAGRAAPYDETGWLTLDHIVPWSLRGGDGVDNLRALCSPCNARKGARV